MGGLQSQVQKAHKGHLYYKQAGSESRNPQPNNSNNNNNNNKVCK